MVLSYIQQLSTSKILLKSATKLAFQLGKSFAVLTESDSEPELLSLLKECKITDCQVFVKEKGKSLVEICETQEVSFLFVQLPYLSSRIIRALLNNCRDLRIPYLFYKDSFDVLNLDKVILPVSFLEEELEKAQFASAFGRFCNSQIIMLLANDYGSKAVTNAEKMKQLFNLFQLKYTLQKAIKDSFKVEAESIQLADNEHAGIIIISASRDYGLDDILFGPKEYHFVKKSSIPVLFVNPRGDLYALCD